MRSQAVVTNRVDVAIGATFVPESTTGDRRAVCRRPLVIIPVVRAEHRTVAVAERIVAGVTRVPGHLQHVVGRLFQYSERAVLGVVPFAVLTRLQVELQLESVGQREVTEQFVAEPVVADVVVETDFKVLPRTVEEVGPVDLVLYQQRDAAGYRTFIIFVSILQTTYMQIAK